MHSMVVAMARPVPLAPRLLLHVLAQLHRANSSAAVKWTPFSSVLPFLILIQFGSTEFWDAVLAGDSLTQFLGCSNTTLRTTKSKGSTKTQEHWELF